MKLKLCKELFPELTLLTRKVKSEVVHNKNVGVQEVFLTEEAG